MNDVRKDEWYGIDMLKDVKVGKIPNPKSQTLNPKP